WVAVPFARGLGRPPLTPGPPSKASSKHLKSPEILLSIGPHRLHGAVTIVISLGSQAFAQQEESTCQGESELLRNKTWYDYACFDRTKECPSGFENPPLLLISFDGFRSDLLLRHRVPTLERLAECGAKADFMRPTFPSATFPNHMTLVTGLYAESHGTIDSKMYDPVLKDTFRASSRDSKWWDTEPIWSTVERSGKKSYTFFWPGSDNKINGTRPSRYFNFPRFNLPSLVTQVEVILSWLDLPKEDIPSFMTLYSHEPDSVFHMFGPESNQGNESLDRVEKMLNRLMSGLYERNLLGCINIIVVSDHGMASSDEWKWIYLHKYANLTNYRSRMGTRTRLAPKEGTSATSESLIERLRCANQSFVAYPKAWLPKRYHYSDHRRIDPIVIDLAEGYITVEENKTVKEASGLHGYDIMLPLMQGFFLAYGKNFKQNVSVRPFRNVEVYGLMAEILNITARPNNGTPGALHYILESPASEPPKPDPVVPLRQCEAPKNRADETEEDGCTKKSKSVKKELRKETSKKGKKNRSKNKHTPWGEPQVTVDDGVSPGPCTLVNEDYISAFDCTLKLPVWNAFTLDSTVQGPTKAREEITWHRDPRVNDTTCNEYGKIACLPSPLYQVPLFPPELSSSGHEEEASLNPNSLPIYFNHSFAVMQYMRKQISLWKKKYGSINVVVGPAFDVHGTGKRPSQKDILASKNGTTVPFPTHVFLVVTRCLKGPKKPIEKCQHTDLDVAAFLIPNLAKPYSCIDDVERYVTKHMATVTDVETLTGLRFFGNMTTYDAIKLRTQLPVGLWSNGKNAGRAN
ncbi:venom phosphodiesterase-like, partial [Ornithodoros turicata]|uniref:venom phosphodiesterase-like n=1 Tax=Ornithodoros turicata TaxID=34597 RepID=UPI00313A2492